MDDPEGRRRPLNPFIFPSETDTRFLLLIFVIVGATLNLGSLLVVAFTKTERISVQFLSGAILVLFVFLVAWQRTASDAKRRIKHLGYSVFPPTVTNSDMSKALQRLASYVAAIRQTIPGLLRKRQNLSLVWDADSLAATGNAFGSGRQQYVCLRQGLLLRFLNRDRRAIEAVLLHELGHIANRDAGKTVFSIQLGRSFYRVAAATLVILDLLIVRGIVINWLNHSTIAEILPSIELFARVNIKLPLLILLVEVIRSSVLRVREYYADARAHLWMGHNDSLLSQLGDLPTETSAESQTTRKGSLRRAFRERVAPLHPTNKARREALREDGSLFRPDPRVAFAAGILTALALNSNVSILFPMIEVLDQVKFFVERALEPSRNLALLSAGTLVLALILIVAVVGVVGLALLFAVLPLVGTLGIQIQRASTAEQLGYNNHRLLSPKRWMLLIGCGASGLVIGSWLTPIGNTVSLRNLAILLLPVYLVGWSIVLLMWALPLRWVSGRLLGRHSGQSPPKRKRRWLTFLSTVALIPGLMVMMLSQNALTSVAIGYGGSIFTDQRDVTIAGSLALILWIGLPFVNLALWVFGGLALSFTANHSSRGSDQQWAWYPAPLELPPLPLTPQTSRSIPDRPPPL